MNAWDELEEQIETALKRRVELASEVEKVREAAAVSNRLGTDMENEVRRTDMENEVRRTLKKYWMNEARIGELHLRKKICAQQVIDRLTK